MPHNPLEALKGATSIGPAPEWKMGMMPMPPGGALKSLVDLIGRRAARPTIEAISEVAPQQVMPTATDVEAIISGLKQSLARTPTSVAKVAPRASQMPAEFIPRGGEAGYNAARAGTAVPRPANPFAEGAVSRYLSKFG